jgi:hemolysin III
MSDSTVSSESHEEHFSLSLFTFTVIVTLAGLLALLRWISPATWHSQFLAAPAYMVGAFLLMSLFNAFVEYFFHRYVLHLPVVRPFRYFYRQHTLHHGLTRIGLKPTRGGQGVLVIENLFPMDEPEQHEASFFPWYSLAIFSAIVTPLLILLQWLAPAFPWFLSGYTALASSLMLYEVLHAINHWPLAKWEPLLHHPRWGGFWRAIYGFHLRHHAVTDCNESISGFFGLPVTDWTFRTCIIPKTVYSPGEEWSADKFAKPNPRWLIRKLDVIADRVVQRRREIARATPPVDVALETPRYTRGEEIANWLTHGLGLLLSSVAVALLVVFATQRGDTWHIVSFSIFGSTLLLAYGASTLYHAWQGPKGKQFLRRIDHAATFLLIAGTYTPFLLVSLRGPWGWTLFGIIWGLCGIGGILEFFFAGRHRLAMTIAYLFVGWLVVVAIKPLVAGVPNGGLWLLLAGGLCYSVGVIFYLWTRLRYHHAMWHLFVLGGSTCHVLAMLLFLLPSQAVAG